MKKIITILVLLNAIVSNSQVAITEVSYDTPFLEDIYYYSNQFTQNPNNSYHHLGEYIELYNYTNEDISLKDWSLIDRVSRYEFPPNAVIRANDFIIVAYGNSQSNYFPSFFPNTAGQEDKIYYQDRIMLRNEREFLGILMGSVRGVKLNTPIFIQYFTWGTMSGATMPNLLDNPFQYDSVNYPGENYYNYPSINLNSFDNSNVSLNTMPVVSYIPGTPNPLSSSYVPATQTIENNPVIDQVLSNQVSGLTYEFDVLEIINTACNLNIIDVDQPPSGIYLTNGKCFGYDSSGNNNSVSDCTNPSTTTNPTTTPQYTEAEIEEFSNLIVMAPNPTNANVGAYWEGAVVGKISQINIFNTSGINILTYGGITASDTSQLINLTGYPTGIYIVDFVLDSGQIVFKNVIKM